MLLSTFRRISPRPTALQLALLALVAAAVLPLAAHAQLAIEMTGAGGQRIPIAVSNFSGDAATAQSLGTVVRADLERSGIFRLIDAGPQPMSETAAIVYGDWATRGADALAAGSLADHGNNRIETRLRVYDIARQQALGGAAFVTTTPQLRAASHRVADFVYEQLTGAKGIFSTRIAYVVKSIGRYELQIADADGFNPQAALISREPIISPSWSPDGSRLAYVSFEQKKPVIYVHSLASGKRQAVANFRGSNSAPAWSPDGGKLAVVLTKDGGSQMFTINADGSGVRRLMSSQGIDTEPQYSADGQWIYFTSDRGGSPQIYRVAASGGDAQRITFDGSYNVSPRPSPDGQKLAFITRTGARFQLAVMDIATHQTQILTDSYKDESPSFAPNGRMILFATELGGRGVLSAVSVDGRVRQRLSVTAGDVREPAWGPFPR